MQLSHHRALGLVLVLAACGGGHRASDMGTTPDGAIPIDLASGAHDMSGTTPTFSFTPTKGFETFVCTKVTIAPVDVMGGAAPQATDTTITLSGFGLSQAFASRADCLARTPATTTLTLPASAATLDFWLYGSVVESVDIEAAATGFDTGTLMVSWSELDVLGSTSTSSVPDLELGETGPLATLVVAGKLFISDAFNHRVLVWNAIPASSATPPDFVLGQPSTSSTVADWGTPLEPQSPTANNLSQPGALASDGTKLFVADTLNCRVLVWNAIPTTMNQPADFALGQAAGADNLTSGGCGTSALYFRDPSGLAIVGNSLFMSDGYNNRVLVWSSIPTAPGPADFALGQPNDGTNLTSNASGTSATTLSLPGGLVAAGGHLYVVDGSNSRVLVWNSIPTAPGPADFALGQPNDATNLTSDIGNHGGISGASLLNPSNIASDGTHLWVADGNSRVLEWTTLPTSPVAAALAIGQPDLVSNTLSSIPSSTNLEFANNVATDGTRLFINDDFQRTLVYSTLPKASGANADYALGTPSGARNFTTSGENVGALDGSSMVTPQTFSSDGVHAFVAETGSNRVLVWNTMPLTSGAPADFALGQPAGADNLFSNGIAAVSGSTFNQPTCAVAIGGKLFVADSTNHRVLVWNTIPSAPVSADFALGQPADSTNLTSGTNNNGGISGSSMRFPNWITSDGTRLFVADYDNHRVLVWNTIPSAPVPANFALGQPADSSNLISRVVNNGGVSGSSMNFPSSVATDGTRLWVVDTNNDRVLVWNTIPTAPAPASFALGQPDLATNNFVGDSALLLPESVTTDGTRLFLSDSGNSRVLVWNPLPTLSGQSPTAVFGQPTFASDVANVSGFSAATLNDPLGLWTDDTRLFIADSGNNRILVLPISTIDP